MAHDTYIDPFGRVVPVATKAMRDQHQILREQGRVLLVILEHEGNLSVECFGPPDPSLADVLIEAAENYRKAARSLLTPEKDPN